MASHVRFGDQFWRDAVTAGYVPDETTETVLTKNSNGLTNFKRAMSILAKGTAGDDAEMKESRICVSPLDFVVLVLLVGVIAVPVCVGLSLDGVLPAVSLWPIGLVAVGIAPCYYALAVLKEEIGRQHGCELFISVLMSAIVAVCPCGIMATILARAFGYISWHWLAVFWPVPCSSAVHYVISALFTAVAAAEASALAQQLLSQP